MTYEIAGQPLTELTLDVPLRGAWTARASHTGTEPLTGPVSIVLGSVTWAGHAVSSQVDGAGTVRTLLVGGAGGLRTYVAPRWSDVAAYGLEDLARELCALGGESLASAPDRPVPRYQRAAGTVGSALEDLTLATETRWRIGASGSAEIVEDSDPSDSADAPGQLLSRDHSASTYSATDGLDLVDRVVDGEPVRHAYIVVRDSSMRITTERFTPSFASTENKPLRDVYKGRVIAQIGNAVDIAADGWALSRVPLYLGVAGASVSLLPGTECLYMFVEGDPSQPIAMLSPNANLPPTSVSWRAALGANKLTVSAAGVITETIGAPPVPVVRTGDTLFLITTIPLIIGIPTPVIVGPSISLVTGLPSTLKTS